MAGLTRYQSRWSGPGGSVKTALRLNGAALKLFSPAEGRKILKAAIQDGVNMWRAVFLPKRFSDYAYKLGYRITAKWENYKIDRGADGTPFVGIGGNFTAKRKGGGSDSYDYPAGTMRRKALTGNKLDVVVTPRRTRMNVKIPFGHPVQARTVMQFRYVPPWELERVADQCVRTLKDLLSQGRSTGKAGRFTLRGTGSVLGNLGSSGAVIRRPPRLRGSAGRMTQVRGPGATS